jgi:hypothetical protein
VTETAETFQEDQSKFDVTLNVNAPQQTAALGGNQMMINAADSIVLTWSTANATSTDVDGVGPNVASAGSKIIQLIRDA